MKEGEYLLAELEPEWVASDVDWGAGVSWRCWRHAGCRPQLYFRNPVGGARPMRNAVVLYQRHGSSFAALSVEEFVALGECFRGYLAGGLLMEDGA
jgi:hypothetical protein